MSLTLISLWSNNKFRDNLKIIFIETIKFLKVTKSWLMTTENDTKSGRLQIITLRKYNNIVQGFK